MSVRRKTTNRLTLYRKCGTCGREFRTTADCPWMRQLPRDGKKQATTYYCSTGCYAKSYKHIGWYDGKALQRRQEREAARGYEKERADRYRAEHREEINAKARERYWANRDEMLARMAYNRKKRKLLQEVPV